MATKVQLIAATLCLFLLTVGLLGLTSSSGGATEDFEEQEVERERPRAVVLPSPAPLAEPGLRWDVEKWDTVEQLPIRRENPMYVPREDSWEQRAALRDTVLGMKGWVEADHKKVFDEFYPLVGGQGLIEVLDFILTKDKKFSANGAHYLGEYLFEKAEGNWEDLGEIVSRNLLKKAPLHGAIWSLVAAHGVGEPSEFYDFVSNLCWYEDMPELFPVWIACVHGVGHGVAKLYEDDVQSGMAVCAKSHSPDFQYSCATGIYMDQSSDPSWSPCDVGRFPAACFRFKSTQIGKLSAAHVARPCDQFESRYTRMGCIWAHGFLMSSQEALDRCRKMYHRDKSADYSDWELDQYMACLSGAWESNRLTKRDPAEAKRYCHTFHEREIAEFCLAHTVILPGDEEARWDGTLLEKYYDPYAAPVEVPFPFPPE